MQEAQLWLALVLQSTRGDNELLELLKISAQVTAESGENWGCSLPRVSPVARSSQSPLASPCPAATGAQAARRLNGEQL